jgi:purine-nucleoside phosphorylase
VVAPKTPTLLERVVAAANALRARVHGTIDWAWIAEGGIGGFERSADPVHAPVAAKDLEGFAPRAPGRFLVLRAGSRRILAFDGGPLLAEGAPPQTVAMPVWLFKRLGAERLVITGGAGALDPSFESPSIVGIDDHINFSGLNPLHAPLDEELGPKFPDLARVYDEELLHRAEEAAARAGVPFRRGVVAATAGPNFETTAERNFLRSAGAHVVAQSMVVPALAAAHAGLRTLALAGVVEPFRGAAEFADPAAMARRAEAVSGFTERLIASIVGNPGT